VGIREHGGARLRRAARGRAGVAGLALALYFAAGIYAASPALGDAGSHFLGYGRPVEGRVTPGDHLQTAYNLWLPGHQLARGAGPWLDQYSFQPIVSPRVNFAGWPFAVVYGPLKALFGTVVGWNLFVLLTYVGAGGFAALWLRALGLPLGAALVGGLAFALAPYRSLQTAGGHLLAPVSMLLPLSLWGLETRRAWLAVAALSSIPLSGQVHLALGAIPFFLAYALVRGERRPGLAAAVSGVAAGMLVYLTSIRGTTGASGRSFGQVERYSAEMLDFVTRHSRHGFETFVFLGWLIPVAAVVGLVFLARRDRALALVLGLGVLVPILFALGSNTPIYEPLWEAVPGLGQTRVPARLLPIACLSLAALVAFALARVRWRYAAVAAVVLVAADLRIDAYDPLVADEGNSAYSSIAGQGRLVELPVFRPEQQQGSVYLYYAMQAPRERLLGYSTTADSEADRLALRLRGLECGRADFDELRQLGVRFVALHLPLYRDRRPRCVNGARLTLSAEGFVPLARDDGVEVVATPR
jgi:hypothetical protein